MADDKTERVTWIDMGQLGAGRWVKSSDGRQIAVFYGPNVNPHADRDVATAVRASNRDHLFDEAATLLREIADRTLWSSPTVDSEAASIYARIVSEMQERAGALTSKLGRK